MKTLLIIALASLAVAAPANAATPTLKGTVGPGETITLKLNKTKVKTLKAGKYKVVIYDKSSDHNFRLKGPAKYSRVLAGIGFVGTTKTYEITLRPGFWSYVCDPHSERMHGGFKVTK
jgi:plastocyanin